ncbi:MAG: PQQ-binding-like beta-propeller repeat protein [Pseudomonadota bacterium]
MRRFSRTLTGLFVVAVCLALVILWPRPPFGEGPRASSGDPPREQREVAFVSNSVEGTVSIIDLAEARLLHTLNIAPDGLAVGFWRDPLQWVGQSVLERRAGRNYAQDTDLSRDGTVLFVSRGYLGDVIAMDIANGSILWRRAVSGVRSDHMALSHDGERLYVSTLIGSGDRLQVLDSASGEVIGEFRAGRWPHDVWVSPDDERVYVASLGDMLAGLDERGAQNNAYTITIAETESLSVLQRHQFAAGVRPFEPLHSESTLFVQLSNTHDIIRFDTQSGDVTQVLTLPVDDGVTDADWDFEAPHHGLAITADETRLCIAGRASDYAAIVSTGVGADGQDSMPMGLLATVDTGDAPSWAAVSADGGTCVLPNTRSDDVSLVNLNSHMERVRVPVGRGPKHVTVGFINASLFDAGP